MLLVAGVGPAAGEAAGAGADSFGRAANLVGMSRLGATAGESGCTGKPLDTSIQTSLMPLSSSFF